MRGSCKLRVHGAVAHVLGVGFWTEVVLFEQFREVTTLVRKVHAALDRAFGLRGRGGCVVEARGHARSRICFGLRFPVLRFRSDSIPMFLWSFIVPYAWWRCGPSCIGPTQTVDWACAVRKIWWSQLAWLLACCFALMLLEGLVAVVSHVHKAMADYAAELRAALAVVLHRFPPAARAQAEASMRPAGELGTRTAGLAFGQVRDRMPCHTETAAANLVFPAAMEDPESRRGSKLDGPLRRIIDATRWIAWWVAWRQRMVGMECSGPASCAIPKRTIIGFGPSIFDTTVPPCTAASSLVPCALRSVRHSWARRSCARDAQTVWVDEQRVRALICADKRQGIHSKGVFPRHGSLGR